MRPRLFLLALLASGLFAGSIAAPSWAGGGSFAVSIVGELAKPAVKQGIAYLAPDLAKHIDPTSYSLSAIQAQLDQIQNSLVNLQSSVNRLDLRLACDDQRKALEPTLVAIITAEKELKNASLAPTPDGRKARLEEDVLPLIKKLNGDGAQLLLHRTLTGQSGESLITACGKWLEELNGPVLTDAFSNQVESLYDTYAMAAATLAMLRVNYWHYYPERYTETEIQQHVAQVQQFLTTEKSFLRPAVPWWGAFDLSTGWAWEKRTLQVSHLYASSMHAQGYKLSGWDGEPSCGDIVHLIQGFSSSVAVRLGIAQKLVRCHNGYDGVINLWTKDGGNTGLSFTELQALPGMASKPWNVRQYSYR